MAWSKFKTMDFETEVRRGRKPVLFALKNATTLSLGVINKYLARNPIKAPDVISAMNFLNHLFAIGPSDHLIPIGRKFFTDNEVDIKREGVLEFRTGLFQAVHFGGQKSLTLNIDITTGVFWNSSHVTAFDLAVSYLNVPPTRLSSHTIQDGEVRQLSRVLKGLKYRVTHRGEEFAKRQHTIAKVIKISARDHKFQLNDDSGRTISVEEYMKKTYNLRLQHPQAILLLKGDSTYLPMELCKIVPVKFLIRDV
jgi:PAZ domain/Argonaute linker 1 domain